MIHHFTKLGLTPDAGTEEIKASYRRLVKKFHPDMAGGNAIYFAQIKTAYDALSDDARRENFLRNYKGRSIWRKEPARAAAPGAAEGRAHKQPQNGKNGKNGAGPRQRSEAEAHHGAGANGGPRAPHPPITRIMSIAMARSGTLLLDGLGGRIILEATTPFSMWETTLAKFGHKQKQHLARHVVQVKVTGDPQVARQVRVRATDFGVEIKPEQGSSSHAQNGNGLVFRCTVPTGIRVHFRNIRGSITVGDLDNDLRANLDWDTKLRAGRISHASLVMKGSSMAFLSHVKGTVDALLGGSAKLLLDGELSLLRAVLENSSVLEVVAAVQRLQADVLENGFLHAKHTVSAANLEAHGNGYVRIAQLKSYLAANRSGRGRIDVLKKPMFVPVNRSRAQTATGFTL